MCCVMRDILCNGPRFEITLKFSMGNRLNSRKKGKYYHGRQKISFFFGQLFIISNGNRTEWSPIRSVIIRVINKIRRPRSGSPICLITSMITDRIGRHEVLLPINHNFNKICNIIGYFLNQNKGKSGQLIANQI